jgi:hypothetical protein
MTYHFKGIITKILPETGQFITRQQHIVVGGLLFTLLLNDCRKMDNMQIGTEIEFDFYIKGIETKQGNYFNQLIIC